MQQQASGFNIHKLEQEVKTRWLKPHEVLSILQNHEWFTVTHKPPHKPPSGSWFLYNRRVLRYFRNDGYEWQKKKNGKTINEAHERLKVDSMEALNCYYARADKNPTFQRRIYWMLDPDYEHIVFVHYRDVLEGRISVTTPNDSPISNQNGNVSRAEAHSSPGWTSELIASCPNSCSPGSVEDAALRKLEMQLSLEDKEGHDANVKEVSSNNEHTLVHGIQNGEPDTCVDLVDIFNVRDFCEYHSKENGNHPLHNAIDVLKNSDTWLEEDQLEAILHPASVTVTENQWFHIHEVSPEWAFCSESTKVIIAGDFVCNPSNSSWAILFGDVKVPVEIVQQGVIRCHTPCLYPGKVRMCMIDGNGKPCSEAREFEFHDKATKSMIDGNGKPCSEAREFKFHQKPTKSSDELLLLLNYVQILFDGHGCRLFSESSLSNPNCGNYEVNSTEIMKKTCEHLDHEIAVYRVMEVLLNDKFEQWLSSKCEQNSKGDHFLPKQYHSVIHTIAALGYDWALKPLLRSGVPINYRDANGWTGLHWAARFGREEMVAVLLAEGAAAGALSHPTSEDPAAKTPASIASAYGFEGLSAFLSEAQLTTHLHSLESKGNENCKDLASGGGITSAVDRILNKSTHAHGGTDDQLALKDSLGATRNAVQAAGRIQAAFRVFSFRKKQEMALQNRNSCILSIGETVAVSYGRLERAALSIQKNFRCWRKRNEFLKLRKNAIKIQARVRAHQERKKYRELLRSVGILEKLMLRWHRKGVGLRGFNSGEMPIDEKEEDDIVKVFRKQRVETALNEAVSRVSSITGNSIARLQYQRTLEMYQQAKDDHEKQ
ncbi:calmodulin-binding transcription activator 4-like isoform X2 [Phragmites australis]|uniref:calmodulin-binding transcription activator 4-like isoform X2 n=1 Tax=Phragmites australis TaxID=29695 RepID=UPI002D76F493|nr:calmodulin-binding transcription activator 4-like isoform X2 [Phragmites australis]